MDSLLVLRVVYIRLACMVQQTLVPIIIIPIPITVAYTSFTPDICTRPNLNYKQPMYYWFIAGLDMRLIFRLLLYLSISSSKTLSFRFSSLTLLKSVNNV